MIIEVKAIETVAGIENEYLTGGMLYNGYVNEIGEHYAMDNDGKLFHVDALIKEGTVEIISVES